MNLARKGFDLFYDSIKPAVFSLTANDPEVAHKLFVGFCRTLDIAGLSKLILDNEINNINPGFEISNAAGFNKNGEIPPRVLKYLGFDRNVVGTVTYESWKGNPRPRSRRYISSESLVNWMGLPGEGATIFERLDGYRHNIPTTISVMSTPGKQGDEALRDIESTVSLFKHLSYVDRFQLNTSCPNTHNQSGELDARRENEKWLGDMVKVVRANIYPHQEVEVKVSPDIDLEGVEDIIRISGQYVNTFVTTNTTRFHDPRFIFESLKKGGASGNALYTRSFEVQKMFDGIRRIGEYNFRLTACGGINSVKRLRERIENGASGIEVYTPIIFSGTKLLRVLRNNEFS